MQRGYEDLVIAIYWVGFSISPEVLKDSQELEETLK